MVVAILGNWWIWGHLQTVLPKWQRNITWCWQEI